VRGLGPADDRELRAPAALVDDELARVVVHAPEARRHREHEADAPDAIEEAIERRQILVRRPSRDRGDEREIAFAEERVDRLDDADECAERIPIRWQDHRGGDAPIRFGKRLEQAIDPRAPLMELHPFHARGERAPLHVRHASASEDSIRRT
jgi:hypothetical protein